MCKRRNFGVCGILIFFSLLCSTEVKWFRLKLIEQEERRSYFLVSVLLISSHMVLGQLIHFSWTSVSSSVHTNQIDPQWYYLLTEGQRVVYVLYTKGQTGGIILDWKRMCGSHAFWELHKFPQGLVTCCEPSRSPRRLAMVINMTPLNKTTLNTKKTKQ